MSVYRRNNHHQEVAQQVSCPRCDDAGVENKLIVIGFSWNLLCQKGERNTISKLCGRFHERNLDIRRRNTL
jgi:hypothetical protein